MSNSHPESLKTIYSSFTAIMSRAGSSGFRVQTVFYLDTVFTRLDTTFTVISLPWALVSSSVPTPPHCRDLSLRGKARSWEAESPVHLVLIAFLQASAWKYMLTEHGLF